MLIINIRYKDKDIRFNNLEFKASNKIMKKFYI